MTIQLVIPMSGLGKRFRAHGYDMPKPLIQVAGAPMIQHVLEMYPDDIDVLFIVNEEHLAKQEFGLEALLLDLRPKAQIAAISTHNTGPSGAIALARSCIDLDARVIVNYCDFSCQWDFDGFVDKMSYCDGVVATYQGFHPHLTRSTKFAYVKGKDDRVTGIQEKQSYTKTPMMERASSGTYGFSSGSLLLDAIDKQMSRGISLCGEYYTSLTYVPLIEEGRLVLSHNIDRFFQWGTPEDLRDFESAFTAFQFISQNPPKKKQMSTILLAAGLGSRFSQHGYTVPKASLPLSGKPAWTQVLRSVQGSGQAVIVCRIGVLETLQAKQWGEVVEVTTTTSGQAASALIGLNRLQDQSVPVTIASCDALFPTGVKMSHVHMAPTISVLACQPGPKAYSNPEQFAWVSIDEHGRVLDLAMKTRPSTEGHWLVVTGTFTFESSRIAKSYIEELIDSNLQTNGEFYLDNTIAIALSKGDRVEAEVRMDFIGIGTPEEYESFRYWQGTFHNWKHSTYDIDRDWLVSPESISKLITESRSALNTPLVGNQSDD